jgi:RNA polymerase primary sigma factor
VGEILSETLIEDVKIPDKTFESFAPLGEQLLPEYLQVLKGTPVLRGDRELRLFRQYNCYKYMAYTLRSRIKLARVSSALLRQAESYLSQADDLERLIVEANLRLVVSIASRHSTGVSNFADMVSKGNYALIKAVQDFDYTTGFRFGKRASLAIAKEYAKVSGKSTELTRTKAASIGTIQQRLRETVDIGALERARHSLTQVIRSELEPREQFIILHHFGLVGHGVRKQRKTLNQIGQELQLSTERVRQLELAALQKLRQCLSRKEFELLTE